MPFQKGHKLGIGNKYRVGIPPANKGKPMSSLSKEKCRRAKLGKKASLETRLKMRVVQTGHHRGGWKHSQETKNKISLSTTGEKNHSWIENRTIYQENKRLRSSLEYVDWRTKVFQRDNYTCQECGSRGVYLQADHIKPFAFYPELRFAIDNGRTLCVPCHKKTNTYAGKLNKKLCQNNHL